MKLFLSFLCLFIGVSLRAQVVSVTNPTNTIPNLAATYTSLDNAIIALQGITSVSGPVTITLNAGNPQTAPAGGYVIQFAATANAGTPISIQGNNNIITASTAHTSGVLTDAIFKIIGADFITISNFTMVESTNTNTILTSNNMTEWGVALLYSNNTNGAQNNTILNNNISLNKTYPNTFGIYSNVRHSAVSISTVADIVNGTTAPNSNNKVYGNSISNVNWGITFIGSNTDAYMDVGNDIGGTSTLTGNAVTNWGGSGTPSNYQSNSTNWYGILDHSQKNENVSNNTISSGVLIGTNTIRGIFKRYGGTPNGTFNCTIKTNSITLNSSNASTFEAIRSEGITGSGLATASFDISENQFLNLAVTGALAGATIVGISNTSVVGTLNISDNIFRGNTSTATTGGFTAISNTGGILSSLTISNNKVGDALGNAITFTAATGGTLSSIIASAGPAATVSINNNNCQGFVQNVTGSGSHAYISLTQSPTAPVTININSNTFNTLTANTSNNVSFINRSGAMISSAGATLNCSGNSIITSFSKPAAGGSVTLYTTSSNSASGNTQVQTGNDFSNITLTGATTMVGWNNLDGSGAASGPTKTINNNIFRNWIGGSSPVNVIQSNGGGDNTTVSSNIIENISGAGAITVISLGTTNRLIHTVTGNTVADVNSTAGVVYVIAGGSTGSTITLSSNTISNIASSGLATEVIRITAAATLNILKNKIYGIGVNNVTGVANGINITTVNINAVYTIANNYIGNIEASISDSSRAINGIAVSAALSASTVNIFYNTIYLNATSSGTNFGSAGLYLTANGNATNASANVRNNIVVNLSTASGTGLTVSIRRSAVALNNYTTTSNNNIYYSGMPTSSRLIYFDGTNVDQTLSAFKTRVGATRESASFTELPPFLSTVGTSANYLHISAVIATQVESGAVNISGFDDDFDGNIRQGNTGYTGSGTAPDIGADELEGVYTELNPPVIAAYTAISTPRCTYSGNGINGVSITDATGVPLSGVNIPRIYYRRNSGTWFSRPGVFVSGVSTNSVWNFTIVESDLGTITGGDVISYYLIAQDLVTIPNTGSNPAAGLVASGVNNVTTHPTSPNSFTLLYNLSGTYTVGSGGNFTTLTSAINAYNNACSIVSATVFELIDDSYPSEVFPITINNHVDAGVTKTLTIRPAATAVPVIVGSAANIISLNGARYIIFNGRQGGVGTVKSMTITNNNISGNTIQFINDAQNNVIRNSIVRGSSSSSTRATILFSTAVSTGNINNLIEGNDICDGVLTPANGILSIGTASRTNNNITISNNNIYNYYIATNRSVGINIQTNSSQWNINGNRLYQTAPRLYTATTDHYAMWINVGSGYSIANNTIGFANESGTGFTEMIGNSATIPGFPTSYSEVAGVAIRYIAINCNFDIGGSLSFINGNKVSGIAMYTSSPGFSTYGAFCGIYVESGNAEIGTTEGNIIGSSTSHGSIYFVSTADGARVVAIRAATINSISITNNIIGGIDASSSNGSISAGFAGISTGGAGAVTISNNSIGNALPANIRVGTISSGSFLSNTGITAASSGLLGSLNGIVSTPSDADFSISGNTLQGWQTGNTATPVTGIIATSSNFFTSPAIAINNNIIGTVASGWINYTVANSAQLLGINITNSTPNFSAPAYSINNNSIRGLTYSDPVSSTGQHNFINVAMSNIANNPVTISGNTFIDLDINTSGATSLISHSYSVNSGGAQTISNNSISGSFIRRGTFGELSLLRSIATSVAGAQINHSSNNFSNITVFGTSTIAGFFNHDGSTNPTKNVTGNTCSNWSGGSGNITAFDYDYFGGSVSAFSNNIVSSISGEGNISGVVLSNPATVSHGNATTLNVANNTISNLTSVSAGGNVKGLYFSTPATNSILSGNTIYSLSSTGSVSSIEAIIIQDTANSEIHISKNKVYDVAGNQPGSVVIGITILSGNVVTLTNNLIGDLRASVSAVPTSISGINIQGGNNVNVFYNTIHLNATGSASVFSTAAVYSSTNPVVNLRNNIFSNQSIPGTSGKSVAHWRDGVSLANYASSSDNNLFYCGVPSPNNLIYFDGSNSDQAFSSYQLRVGARDANSVSTPPAFLSLQGSSVDFLHLNSSNGCATPGNGNNIGILLATDFDGDARSITSPFITAIGADEGSKANVWTGAVSSDWNNALNWNSGVPAGAGISVRITSQINQPVIAAGDTYQIGSLLLDPGATLINLGTLKIAGSITAPSQSISQISAGNTIGSIELNGTCYRQVLSGNIFLNNSIKNLTISNDVDFIAGASENVNLTGSLLFGSTGNELRTLDNLTLVSTASATADLSDVTGNVITGQATVERYINTGLTTDGRHAKSWQFLSTPTLGQSVFESWQENGSNAALRGTWMSGPGIGFDVFSSLPSLKVYNDATNNWDGVANTSNSINDKRGYFIFIRGDRTVRNSTAPATPTTLRTKGSLYQPTFLPPLSTVAAGGLQSVGNPYASAIDVEYMHSNGLFNNINNDVIVWDPLLGGAFGLGGYQTLSAANNYEPTPGGTAFYPTGVSASQLQSGAAFFVRSSGSAGSVTFNESCKVSGSRLVNRRSPEPGKQFLRTYLFTDDVVADGNAVIFSSNYSNAITADDAIKIENTGENFGLIRNSKKLSVETRRVLNVTDTIFYYLNNLKRRPYKLRFAPNGFNKSVIKAFLVDRYLQTKTPVSLLNSTTFNFEVNQDPLSNASNRFYVVFSTRSKLNNVISPASEKTIRNDVSELPVPTFSIYPNPVEPGNMVSIKGLIPGNHLLQLFHSSGQVVYRETLSILKRGQIISLKSMPHLSFGNYRLVLIDNKGQTFHQSLLIR